MLVSWVDKSPFTAKKWNDYFDHSMRPTDSKQFLHYLYYIVYMFQDIVRVNLIETGIPERIRKFIEVMYYVGIAFRVDVDANGPWPFPFPASYIQDRHCRP